MELRQLRYFVQIVDMGSMGKAAVEHGVATAALSQQISRLESELGVALLVRHSRGVVPTAAGAAFYRRAQLLLRHADAAATEAKHAHLSGSISIGFTPATAGMLGSAILRAMHERYPEVRLYLIEAFSGFLSQMLNARKIDLAVLFQTDVANRWNATPLLQEELFAICSPTSPHAFSGGSISLRELARFPMVLPSRSHGLRATLDAAFSQGGVAPNIIAEIDSLGMLMDAVQQGYGVTVQQSSVAARPPISGLSFARVSDPGLGLQSFLVNVAEDEASPTVSMTRKVILETVNQLVRDRKWMGATLSDR